MTDEARGWETRRAASMNERSGGMIRHLAIAIFLALAVGACGSSSSDPAERSPADTTSGAETPDRGTVASSGEQCVFPMAPGQMPSTPCPARCAPITGLELDRERQCTKAVLVGCLACEDGGCGGAPEGRCYQHADGRVVRVTDDAVSGRSDWSRCSAADDELSLSPRCD